MDPTTPSRPLKDGNWEFPDNISFPVYVRVKLKMFKVAKGDQDGQTKYLNTKIMKVEVSLEKEDLISKASLLAAIERDGDVRKLAGEENILNPKMENSIKQQDS